MSRLREQVTEFHRTFDIPVGEKPHVPSDDVVRLRLRLIFEEAFELLEATTLEGTYAEFMAVRAAVSRLIDDREVYVRLPDFVDALADIDYVVEGSRVSLGVDGDPIADEVHRSNMTKVGGHKRADGKWVKPESYSPADIEGELRKQGWGG